MEAPKKIYLQENTTTDYYGKFWPEWFEARLKDSDIEYTRTDVIIEKTIKYIANHFLAPGMDNEINDFVNYMKGR